jgi:glycosyltransferase involved in cell wall biosynthesis
VALWSAYPKAPFVAVSKAQASLLRGLNVVGIVHHAVDGSAYRLCRNPEDYLLFLGRFTEGKGVLQAIEVARRTGLRLMLAAAENDYFREVVAPHVDGREIVYAGEVEHAAKVTLLGGARALIYPVQAGEPFGLVLTEAMACGTPVAALDRGAVKEIVEGLPGVLALDRERVRAQAMERFGPDQMVDGYVAVYTQLVTARRRAERTA